jgi:tol-pal system protein YbgF
VRTPGAGIGKGWLAVLAVVLLPACASKSDVQDMEATMLAEMHALRMRQDSLTASMNRLREVLLDTLGQRDQASLNGRGELSRRFQTLQDQLAQVTALVGQNQRLLAGLQGRSGAAAPDTTGGANAPPTAAESAAGGGSETPTGAPVDTSAAPGQAGKLYQTAMQQYRRGAYGTARSGLQAFLQRYPDNQLAPDAQYYIGETYAQQSQPEKALDAYARVLQLFPNSRRAPAALYKSGLLEVQRGNVQDARTYFSRVVRGYPDSDEAGLARQQLAKLKG